MCTSKDLWLCLLYSAGSLYDLCGEPNHASRSLQSESDQAHQISFADFVEQVLQLQKSNTAPGIVSAFQKCRSSSLLLFSLCSGISCCFAFSDKIAL